jgi:hypothetical protein
MGGSVPEDGQETEAIPCGGEDVIRELNGVFSNPNSAEYKHAQKHNTFGAIQNVARNYNALIEAYTAAGAPVGGGWVGYLKKLGTVGTQGPQNIYDIAQARHDALTKGMAMSTTTHPPKDGGHVHIHRPSASAGGSVTIDSPFPLP